MPTLKFVIKKGQVKKDGTTNIKLRITQNRKVVWIPTAFYIKPNEFDADSGSANNKHKSQLRFNAALEKYKLKILEKIFDIPGYNSMPVSKLVSQLKRENSQDAILLTEFVDKILPEIKRSSKRNGEIYSTTRDKVEKYESNLYLHQIDKQFLKDFDYWMFEDGKAVNTRSFYHRTLRAILNKAIDDDEISYDLAMYPYRGFKIKQENTRSRHLELKELRMIYEYQSDNKYRQRARDVFMMMFYLRGISTIDLYNIMPPENKRVHYIKTRGKGLFEIELIGEAIQLFEKYKDPHNKKALNFYHTFSDHRNLYKSVNDELDEIRKELTINAKITSYYSRHTWAHIALNECGINKDVIAAALGHSRTRITDIYARTEQKLIDEANKKVLKKLKTLPKKQGSQ